MVFVDCPLQQAMADNGTEAGSSPSARSRRLARAVGRAAAGLPAGRGLAIPPLVRHPRDPDRSSHRSALAGAPHRGPVRPARPEGHGLLGAGGQARPATRRLPAHRAGAHRDRAGGGGFYAGPPPFDVSHGELVSTVDDFARFARLLAHGGRIDGQQILSPEHSEQMTSDQVPTRQDAGQLLPRLLGRHGLGLRRRRRDRGRADRSLRLVRRARHQLLRRPDGTVGVLLTQVELGEQLQSLLEEFQALREAA